MIDTFWLALISTTVSVFAVSLTALAYREAKQRGISLADKEALLPDAVRQPALREEVARLQAERDVLEPRIAEAKAKSEYAKNIQNWLNNNLSRYEKAVLELPSLRGEIDLRRTERDALLQEALAIREQAAAAQRDFAALQVEMAPARLVIERKENAETWLQSHYAAYETAKASLPLIREELANAVEQRDDAIKRRDEATNSLIDIQQRHAHLLAEMAPAQLIIEQRREADKWLTANSQAYERAKSELPQLQDEILRAETDLDTALLETDSAVRRRDEMQKEHRTLFEAMAPAQLVIEQRRQAEGWLSKNSEHYERARQELPAFLDRIVRSKNELKQLKTATTAAQVELNDVTRSLVCHKAECDGLARQIQRHTGELKTIQEKREQLSHELAELQARQAGLLMEIEQDRVQRDAANLALSKARTELSDALRELDRRREDLAELETERATKLEVAQMLDRLVKKLEADKKQVEDELDQSKQRLQRELDQINDLLAAATKRWSDVGPTVGASDTNRLAELWTPVLKKSDFRIELRAAAEDGERQALERTSQHLQQLGLRFGQRVLHAFHTSLKVAEMSPLVVLAGISGTGKSELPRRYAEGMGMHSLTLAVQPRWDSPQDMFGFYNFLESRYRATELARALVQMDRFAKERQPEWHYDDKWLTESLSDRMLLVLLDEMNLARVEYYFSEFLSKLETRRGIDRDNACERRKAEIMLEVGLQSMQRKDGGEFKVIPQPTLPLFVDRNVLFVGTMNEDESTQALSDKVVDRANVLRFGKPHRLGAENATPQSSPTDAWLPFATWEQWVASEDTLKSAARTEFDGWVQDLNQAMQSIGRPFAHRTYGAMLSYLANYPDPEQYKLAMADQIELKLLPKFRGLDPHDTSVRNALAAVQKVVDQTADEKLSQALRNASRLAEHQFVWHGVDRMDER